MWGELHEVKSVSISLPETLDAGKGNRLFQELGATLHYDIYSFEAKKFENWQSKSLLYIELRNSGISVSAQENFDEIIVLYPFATRPSADQSIALRVIAEIVFSFGGIAIYHSCPFSIEAVQKDWDSCNDFLLKEWGEEPGSKVLRRMIEENHA